MNFEQENQRLNQENQQLIRQVQQLTNENQRSNQQIQQLTNENQSSNQRNQQLLIAENQQLTQSLRTSQTNLQSSYGKNWRIHGENIIRTASRSRRPAGARICSRIKIDDIRLSRNLDLH